MLRLATFWFIVGTTFVVLVWDAVVAIVPPTGDTISKVLRALMQDYVSIAFVTGALGGHVTSTWRWMFPLWWYWMSLPLLALSAGIFVFMDAKGISLPLAHEAPLLYVALGVVFGHMLWPQ